MTLSDWHKASISSLWRRKCLDSLGTVISVESTEGDSERSTHNGSDDNAGLVDFALLYFLSLWPTFPPYGAVQPTLAQSRLFHMLYTHSTCTTCTNPRWLRFSGEACAQCRSRSHSLQLPPRLRRVHLGTARRFRDHTARSTSSSNIYSWRSDADRYVVQSNCIYAQQNYVRRQRIGNPWVVT